MKTNCYVCDVNTSVDTRSSGIAPISGGVCAKCLEKNAENLDVIHLWIAERGGLSNASDHGIQLTSYFQGDYIGWNKISEIYAQNEEAILEEWNQEYELIDTNDDSDLIDSGKN